MEPQSSSDLRAAVISGMAWMVSLRWAFKLLGLINIFILARILVPEEFGLVAMAMIVVNFMEVWVAFGVENALIQQADSTDDDYNTAWTLGLLQKIFVAVCVVLAIPLAQSYFDDNRLPDLLYVLAGGILITGFTNIGVVRFIKELDFRAEFIISIVPKVVQFVITIGIALWLRNYWALVIGIVVGYVGTVTMSYIVCDFRPRLSLKCLRRIWSFSQWSMLMGIGNFVLYRANEVIVGGHGRAQALGLYNMASELGQLPATELMAPLNRVLFPAYSKLQDDRARYQAAFLNGLSGVATVLIPAGIGIALVASDLVPVALGDKWLDATPYLVGMATYGVMRGLILVTYPALNALGHIRNVAIMVWVQGIVTVLMAVSVIETHGVMGVVVTNNLALMLGLILVYATIYRIVGVGPLKILRKLARPLLATAAMIGLVLALRQILDPGFLRLLVCGVSGALSYAAIVVGLWHFGGRPDGIESAVWTRLSPRLSRLRAVRG